MTGEIDPRFQQHRSGARRRRRRATLSRGLLFVGLPAAALAAIATGIALTWDMWSYGPVRISEEELELDIAQVDDEITARTSGFTAAFIDLPGDPMLIRLKETDLTKTTRALSAPPELPGARSVGGLILVSDVMVSTEESFITTLPSSPEDFAFFQSLRGVDAGGTRDVGIAAPAAAQPAPAAPGEFDDDAGGWGTTLDQDQAPLPEFAQTRIENTTSVAFVRPQSERRAISDDVFVRISADRDLAGLLESRGIPEDAATAAEAALQEHFGVAELKTGMVVALRTVQDPTAAEGVLRLVQLSLYDNETYFGSLARASNGTLSPAADPWWEDELFDYAGEEEETQSLEQTYRMLDAFYSAAIRNRVPSVVVGEAIALMSKAHDLDTFANPGDRMQLLYAAEPGPEETGTGQILYIALQGEAVDMECFVYRSGPGEDYGCFGATPGTGGGGAAGGMVTPVNGVLTSRFGPRKHPVLKTVRLHAGVDWAAPTGTPVVAAFAGRVSSAGDAGGYGNLIRLTHEGGAETRYAHLSRFEVAAGAQVAAGEVIGYIGTTGLSTGPHLHFELRLGGTPVDPFAEAGAVAGGGGELTGGGAVEQLVNQIIRVESAGDARAKNPLSTATGLGQFIESTWIRMMQTYRPDLVASLGRAELLELRFDPTISREMVRNLAREGESYLRARGHQITAGRLYLCHFLGAEGAHKVLSSPDEAELLAVLGAGVINANPFLRGKNVAYIKAWAERKMAGRGGTVVVSAPVVREPPGVAEYREMIRTLLGTG